MVFIRTRSGRYINLNHIVGFAVEYEKIELNGRNIQVFEVIAYLPQPLLPAVLAIYSTEERAEEYLNKLVESILKTKTGVVSLETEI